MTLEKAYKKLLIENPFYGLFLLGIPKVLDKEIPTACVRKAGINCEIAINPDYWDSQDNVQQLNLLQHEIYHIVFHHMFMHPFFPNKSRLNIAADCEVNSYLENLDDTWVEASKFGLDEKQGTKYYYEHLPDNLQDYSTIDSHNKWFEDFSGCSEVEQQLIKNQIDAQLKNVAKEVQKMRGTIPAELSEKIAELFKEKPRIFDWKSYFRRMLGSIYDINVKKTRRRESERFPGAAGLKHKKKVSILVGVDTSGSVSNQELLDFFSEITHIYKAGANIQILECDAQISANYQFTGKWTGEIHGRGGTDFQPVIDYYRQHQKDYSSLVYFTDGYCDIPENVPRNTIWVITSNGKKQDYPGQTLYIPKTTD